MLAVVTTRSPSGCPERYGSQRALSMTAFPVGAVIPEGAGVSAFRSVVAAGVHATKVCFEASSTAGRASRRRHGNLRTRPRYRNCRRSVPHGGRRARRLFRSSVAEFEKRLEFVFGQKAPHSVHAGPPRRLIVHENVVAALQRHELSVGDPRGQGPPLFNGNAPIVFRMQHDRRQADLGEPVAHVVLRLHLVFGLGPHRCLGEMRARIEMEESLVAVLDTAPGIELETPPHMLGFGGLRQITPMRVRIP